ncbi:acetyl-CoA carboxylase biotin carboxylase subunit family protein [Halomonas salifodinae]|uniref:Acetyl-CoA carboxylase biotin carboxylase subunit family protein n=1 Tax=Halomonas salifodinae TaxID=438745 RepID=A0ABW2ETQ0_9GAMM
MSYVLCFHRWAGAQAIYDNYPLPSGLMIRALCTPESVPSLPQERLASFSTIDSMDDPVAVHKEIERIIGQHGIPTLVVALNEGDLLSAASVREQYGLRGDHRTWAEQFRDKLMMADIASRQNSISVLPTVGVDSVESIELIANEFGYPLVIKPRYGTASRGVRILRCPEDIQGKEMIYSEPMIAQVYCSSPIIHVDGWWDGQRIVVATASTYVNNCAEYGPYSPLGSIELPAGSDEDEIVNSASELLGVFSPKKEIVFHLELFDTGEELVFLEIGARVGGAEIPFIWRDIRGIDLLGIAWELQVFESTRYRDMARKNSYDGRPIYGERGAWLISHSKCTIDCEVLSLYWSRPENSLSASGIYEGAKTRLRLRNTQRLELEKDMCKLIGKLS